MDVLALAAINKNLPVGFCVESPTMPGPNYLMLAGQDVSRTTYPQLGAMFPVGAFTSTSRSGPVPTSTYNIPIVTDGTTFVAPGDGLAGTTVFQSSTDAATWTSRLGAGSGVGKVCDMVYATGLGKFIALMDSTCATAVQYSVNGTTGWTSGGYAANFGTVGKRTLATDGTNCVAFVAGTTPITTPNGTAWTARSGLIATINCLSYAGSGVWWAGSNTAGLQFKSTDLGVTWVSSQVPGLTSIAKAFLVSASDGAGKIVALSEAGATGVGQIWMSPDSGVTWLTIPTPPEAAAFNPNNSSVTYTNGRWFIAVLCGFLVSTDGESWVYEPMGARGVVRTAISAICYKSGVYASLMNATLGAARLSSTESSTLFRLPGQVIPAQTAAAAATTPRFPLWIKAQ